MSSRLRRTMLLLGTTILVIQTAFMPIGILSAETTMDNDEHEPVELPSTQDSLEELTSVPNFSFQQSDMQGIVNSPIHVTISSDQEVSEVKIRLPEEATVIKDQLSEGTSVVQGDQPNEWIFQSESVQTKFFLPLVFEQVGNYELLADETTVHIEISEQEENVKGNMVNDLESSDEIPITEESTDEKNINSKEIKKSEKNSDYIVLGITSNTRFNGSDRLTNVGTHNGQNIDLLIIGNHISFFNNPWHQIQVNQANRFQFYLHRDLQPGSVTMNLRVVYSGTTQLVDTNFALPTSFYGTTNAISVSNSDLLDYNFSTNTTDSLNYTYTGGIHRFQLRGTQFGTGNLGLILKNNSSIIFTQVIRPANFAMYWFMIDNRGVDALFPSYSVKLEASPETGGSPSVGLGELSPGETTLINANTNDGYTFLRWELNGNGGSIEDINSSSTTFTMGNSDTIIRAIFQINIGKIFVHHVDKEGKKLAQSEEINGKIGDNYETEPMNIENYKLFRQPDNANGKFTEEHINVTYIYDIYQVNPVDPLVPDIEIDPENKPELPENQGFLSIDFVSQFNFGTQKISASDQTYYAQPQRLLNEDGTVNETEERPNFVQISDRRPDDERNGWQLSVTQNGQFRNQSGHELLGTEIQLLNQELVTAQGGTIPELQEEPVQQILPNTRKVLIQAKGESGTGTWIYRLGNQQTADKSVGLHVPGGTNPKATSYLTKLTWELSAVPDN
ncbi:hypothetical protein IGK16_002991 [Enterococcus pernyi]